MTGLFTIYVAPQIQAGPIKEAQGLLDGLDLQAKPWARKKPLSNVWPIKEVLGLPDGLDMQAKPWVREKLLSNNSEYSSQGQGTAPKF